MKYHHYVSLFVSFALLWTSVLCSPARANVLDIDAFVQAMQTQSQKYTTFRTQFTQNLFHKASNTHEMRHGELLFQKPLLLRWETTKPTKELLVINDTAIWNFIIDEEIVYKYPLSILQDSETILQFITGQSALSEKFDIELDSGAEEPQKAEGQTITLHLYAKNPQQTLTEAILLVDEKSKTIQKVTLYDFYGNENSLQFHNAKYDVVLNSHHFAFTVPDGVDVEDKSGDAQSQKLFQ